MPANRASLQITEAYRGKMVALRERAQHDAREVWGRIDQRDLDGTYEVGLLAVLVTAMQREAARLSSGYLQAFIQSELGRPIRASMVDARQVGQARNGDELRKALVSPLITTKVAIRGGKTPAEALVNGRTALDRMVGLATDTAAREALRRGMEDSSHVEGWRRAVRGTCGACMGAAKGTTQKDSASLGIHPNCQCVSEPVVRRKRGDIEKMAPDAKALGDTAALEGLDTYQNLGHSAVNGLLRSPELRDIYLDVRPDALELAKNLDDMFERAVGMSDEARLWRGVETPLEETFPDLAGKELVGKVIDDAGFGSTTVDRGVAERFAADGDVWQLTARPGVKGIRMTRGTGAGEKEVLLNRGLHYLITGVRRVKGRRIIEAEVF